MGGVKLTSGERFRVSVRGVTVVGVDVTDADVAATPMRNVRVSNRQYLWMKIF